jgi:hypothetical protein
MIFEAGENFTFAAHPGDKVKLGQLLGAAPELPKKARN